MNEDTPQKRKTPVSYKEWLPVIAQVAARVVVELFRWWSGN